MQINQELHSSMSRHVRDWQMSGLSQIAYCQQAGITFCKFNYWVRKLRPSSVSPGGFVAIKLEKQQQAASLPPIIELVLPNGTRLNFHHPVDPEYLKKILC